MHPSGDFQSAFHQSFKAQKASSILGRLMHNSATC